MKIWSGVGGKGGNREKHQKLLGGPHHFSEVTFKGRSSKGGSANDRSVRAQNINVPNLNITFEHFSKTGENSPPSGTVPFLLRFWVLKLTLNKHDCLKMFHGVVVNLCIRDCAIIIRKGGS